MVNYTYFDLFFKSSIPKQVSISFDGVVLTNDDLYNQEMELEENLCSEGELRFGSCEASILKFKSSDIFLPMVGKWLDVRMGLEGGSDAPLPLGRYKVDSDSISNDRKYREIVAYDAMHGILSTDVAAWYNSLLPGEGSKVTMKQFRESFVRYFGLTEVTPEGGLVNDGIVVARTIQPGQISGRDVITAICEINGCFGHIGRDGKFHYIYLGQDIGGLYPSDGLFPDHAPEHLAQSKTGHLYPQDPDSYRIGASQYIQCESGKFYTKRIERLQIRNSENEIGKTWPEEGGGPDDNCYVIEDNFLVYGKSDQEMKEIAKNIFGKITDIAYMPFNCDMIGNPCIEVGDAIRIPTKYEIVESYVLQRTLKGIQALRDEIRADGVEKYGDKVNGVQKSIIQLKGKTNELVRNVDETRSTITDVEKGLQSQITQTAGNIEQKIAGSEQLWYVQEDDGSKILIDKYGYGNPPNLKLDEFTPGMKYLDQKNGIVYMASEYVNTEPNPHPSWYVYKKLKSINADFESRISQSLKKIELGVKNNSTGTAAGITIKVTSEDGSVENEIGEINLEGLVSFTNLASNDGKTIIDGGNLKAKTVSCDTLNGGTINGQKIVGGEVNGATIKAKEGIYLQYTNANTIPPISGEYVFARTGYGYESEVDGLSNGAYLELVTPSGSAAIAVGLMGMGGGNFGSMAYFPDGAIISNAEIRNIILTYSMENSFIAEGEEGTRNPHEAQVFAKVFGAFACVYGKYRFHEHRAGENVDIKVGSSGDEHIPKWANVEVCTSYKGSPFVFILQTNGTLRVINASKTDIFATGDDANSYITINFRFDFFRA